MINASNLPGYDFSHYSKVLSRNKFVRIVMPDVKIKAPSTIVYLLHPFGANRFFFADFFKISPPEHAIFVLPESGRSWFINDAKNTCYEDYFIYELIKDVELQFPFLTKRIIGGFSMGGATAFFLSLRHPKLFNLTFSLAGAFDAFEREGDPYALLRKNEGLMVPTSEEHEKVWGRLGSATRKTYNLKNLYNQLQEKIITQFIFEVGLQDYERIIKMNRKAALFFKKTDISYAYNEFSGSHTKEYAYQGLSRIFKDAIFKVY